MPTSELIINSPNHVRNICCGGIGLNSCRCNTAPAKRQASPPEREDLEGYDPTTNRNQLPMETPLTARERADVIPTFNSDDDDFTPQHRSAEMDFAPLGASTLAAGNLDHLFANGMTHDEHLQRLLFGSNFAE